jgi:membrane-associated phospholipid phosphatase
VAIVEQPVIRAAGDEQSTGQFPSVVGPLTAAAAMLVVLAADYASAFRIAVTRHADLNALHRFVLIETEGLIKPAHEVSNSVGVIPFSIFILALVALAWHAARWRLMPAVALILVGANATTQVLKSAIPSHVAFYQGARLDLPPSFPSGHATVTMSVVLCLLILTPCFGRSLVAVVGAAYAFAVGYMMMVLALHFPSDIIAGYLVAGCWAMLAVAANRLIEARWPDDSVRRPPTPSRSELVGLSVGLGLVLAAPLFALAFRTSRPVHTGVWIATTLAGFAAVIVVAGVHVLSAGRHASAQAMIE